MTLLGLTYFSIRILPLPNLPGADQLSPRLETLQAGLYTQRSWSARLPDDIHRRFQTPSYRKPCRKIEGTRRLSFDKEETFLCKEHEVACMVLRSTPRKGDYNSSPPATASTMSRSGLWDCGMVSELRIDALVVSGKTVITGDETPLIRSNSVMLNGSSIRGRGAGWTLQLHHASLFGARNLIFQRNCTHYRRHCG